MTLGAGAVGFWRCTRIGESQLVFCRETSGCLELKGYNFAACMMKMPYEMNSDLTVH